MSRFLKFNDKSEHIIRLDDFDYSHTCIFSDGAYALKIVLRPNGDEFNLEYADKETRDKDNVRLARFLSKKENKNEN